jgi:hypothetical protein
VRLWLHVDGSLTPEWSAGTPALVTGMPAKAVEDLKWFLQQAQLNNIKVLLSL